MRKILYTKSALPFILEALGIKTEVPNDRIVGIKKGETGFPVLLIKKNKMKRKRKTYKQVLPS